MCSESHLLSVSSFILIFCERITYVNCGYLHGKRIQKEGAKHYMCHNLAMGHLGLKGIDFVYFNLC